MNSSSWILISMSTALRKRKKLENLGKLANGLGIHSTYGYFRKSAQTVYKIEKNYKLRNFRELDEILDIWTWNGRNLRTSGYERTRQNWFCIFQYFYPPPPASDEKRLHKEVTLVNLHYFAIFFPFLSFLC